jgi:hypothetical protein
MTNPTFRPLTPAEEELLRWTLEHGTEEAKSYLPQIERIRAASSCTCGCPSISLVVSDGIPAAVAGKDGVVADLSGQTADGISVGVLVFQDDGRLSELELYPYDNDGPFGLPTIESLSPFEVSKPISS